MATISSIKQQVKRTDRYSIFVDGIYVFSLSESELIARGLHGGQELSAEEVKKYKKISAQDKVYGLVLQLVARRPRSEKELRDYLRRKGQDEETIQSILNKLIDIGLLNDEAFARSWVESRRLLKPVSRRRLTQELRQKGIRSDIIETVMGDDQTTDSQTLLDLIERKRKQTKYHDDTKLMQYLSRQGYGYNDIKSALRTPED